MFLLREECFQRFRTQLEEQQLRGREAGQSLLPVAWRAPGCLHSSSIRVQLEIA
jgi:hypothetical protein